MYSIEEGTIPKRGQVTIRTGLAIGLPFETYARIAPRGGLAAKHGITVNAGVIDADYKGEIKVLLVNLEDEDYKVNKGDCIAQMKIKRINMAKIQEVLELGTTERAGKGFGR